MNRSKTLSLINIQITILFNFKTLFDRTESTIILDANKFRKPKYTMYDNNSLIKIDLKY